MGFVIWLIGLLGVLAVYLTVVLIAKKESASPTSTVREFSCPGPLWELVGQWADRKGYSLESEDGQEKLYRKGKGILYAPIYLRVEQNGSHVRLETWVGPERLVRAGFLYRIPAKRGIEPGGIMAVVPRRQARSDVNGLLDMMDQPLISSLRHN